MFSRVAGNFQVPARAVQPRPTHDLEPLDPDAQVTNPVRRALEKTIRRVRSRLAAVRNRHVPAQQEPDPDTANRLAADANAVAGELDELQQQRVDTPTHVRSRRLVGAGQAGRPAGCRAAVHGRGRIACWDQPSPRVADLRRQHHVGACADTCGYSRSSKRVFSCDRMHRSGTQRAVANRLRDLAILRSGSETGGTLYVAHARGQRQVGLAVCECRRKVQSTVEAAPCYQVRESCAMADSAGFKRERLRHIRSFRRKSTRQQLD